MGLDIYAHKKVKNVSTDVFDEDGDYIDPVTKEPIEYDVRIYVNPDFPNHIEGATKGIYTSEGLFHCGWSYGRYNGLRDMLAELAGYPEGEYKQYGMTYKSFCVSCWDGETGPFSELINFSDCEGTIGPVISKKLSADFAEFQSKADAHANSDFREFYNEMRTVFEYGADDGLVKFA